MSATTAHAWFWLGFAAGIITTGTAAYLTGRWLTRHIPVTGPIDTALTPTDGTITADPGEYHIDWSQATVEPARVGGWRPVTPDDTLSADGTITPLPVRHTGDCANRDLTLPADMVPPEGHKGWWSPDERGPTTHYPPYSTHHDLVATEWPDGTVTYGPDDPTGDSR